jgi:thioredoxin reductase (NADPH)
MVDRYDLIVIGAGPAGLTAAIYGRRLGLKVIVFGDTPGGNLMKIENVSNYPGAMGGIGGAQLGAMLFAQAQGEGAFLPMTRLARIRKHEDGFLGIAENGEEYLSLAAIVASGVVRRKPDVPCPGKSGIYYCSLCDGPLFRNKGATLAVLGGGNMAMHEALSLSAFADRVIIIHKENELRVEEALMRQARDRNNIEFLLDAVVQSFHATDEIIDGIDVTVNGKETYRVPVDGVFMAIGWDAALNVIEFSIETTPEGFLKTDGSFMTSMPGLFAAGDVRDTDIRQVITACADGARSANYAFEYIERRARAHNAD